MRITQEADYALRIVSVLAKSEKPIGAPLLAEKVKVPARFAVKILRKLGQSGIVHSTRGINGGYNLSLPSEELSLRRVIEAIDGTIAIRHCLCEEHICANSPDKERCRFHKVFAALNGMITEKLDKLTIGQMTDGAIPVNELINIIK